MSGFDDFDLGGNVGGVVPKYKNSIPTDIKNSRSFLSQGSPLPKFYYDFTAQKRHHAHRHPRTRTQDQ